MSEDEGGDEDEGGELLSTRVVLAVARETGVDPLELPPIGERLDPDALDALFEGRTSSRAELRFEYAGVQVVVREDDVTVQPS